MNGQYVCPHCGTTFLRVVSAWVHAWLHDREAIRVVKR